MILSKKLSFSSILYDELIKKKFHFPIYAVEVQVLKSDIKSKHFLSKLPGTDFLEIKLYWSNIIYICFLFPLD